MWAAHLEFVHLITSFHSGIWKPVLWTMTWLHSHLLPPAVLTATTVSPSHPGIMSKQSGLMTALCRPGNSVKHMADVQPVVESGLSSFVKITLLDSLSDRFLKADRVFLHLW